MDEPLANLDIKYQIELVRLLRRLKEERNISVVMALHDINMALQFESVILIQEGRIIASGNPEAVLTRDMVKQAFAVNVEIKRSGTDGIYVSYEDNF